MLVNRRRPICPKKKQKVPAAYQQMHCLRRGSGSSTTRKWEQRPSMSRTRTYCSSLAVTLLFYLGRLMKLDWLGSDLVLLQCLFIRLQHQWGNWRIKWTKCRAMVSVRFNTVDYVDSVHSPCVSTLIFSIH